MEAIVIGILLIVGAAICHQYVASPLGVLLAVALGLVGVILLVVGLFDVLDRNGVDTAAVGLAGALKRPRRGRYSMRTDRPRSPGQMPNVRRSPENSPQSGLKALLQDRQARVRSNRRAKRAVRSAESLKRLRGRY